MDSKHPSHFLVEAQGDGVANVGTSEKDFSERTVGVLASFLKVIENPLASELDKALVLTTKYCVNFERA